MHCLKLDVAHTCSQMLILQPHSPGQPCQSLLSLVGVSICRLALMLSPLVGKELTVKNISNALKALPPDEYCDLGLELGLEYEDIQKIEMDYPNSVRRQLLGIIQSWINLGQSVSWQTLADTLEDMGQSALASKIHTFYK